MQSVKIKVKLELKELVLLRLKVSYKNPSVAFFIFVIVIIGSYALYTWFNNDFHQEIGVKEIVIALIILNIPTILFISSRNDLKSNKYLSETLNYEFNKNEYFIYGETFNHRGNITDLYKIVEMKDWFLLYTSKQLALFIPKNRFEEKDIEIFQEITSSVPRTER